jgi:hypothetical protein
LADGIPDEAFAPIEGDNKKTAGALRKRNKAERAGQGRFGAKSTITVGTTALAAEVIAIDALVALDLADVHVAAQRLRRLDTSREARRARLVADAWCSSFVLLKTPGAPELTHAALVAIDSGAAPTNLIEAVEAVSAQYRWFHWHIEFPHIFSTSGAGADPVTGWTGGFDCVVGNPPWERVKLQEQEWFAARMPVIAEAPNAAARKKLVTALADEHPEIYREFLVDRRKAEGESHFIRNGGRYPLTGRGDINTYAVFAESDRSLLGLSGQLGVILPAGIVTDATTQHFFKDLVTKRALVSVLHFENEALIFAGVHHAFKFCLLALTGRDAPTDAASFAFFARRVDDLKRDGAIFMLTPSEITLLNPNTGTCPVFRSRRDADITLAIYRRHPVLIEKAKPEQNSWGLSFMTMLHMANDSGLFRTREELEASGWTLTGNVFTREGETMLPLYQGLMTSFYDHRAADVIRNPTATQRQNQARYLTDTDKADPSRFAMPISWVDEAEVESRLRHRWNHDWVLGFSDITSSTNERTMVPCLIPLAAVGHSLPLALETAGSPACFAAALSSIVFDFVARQKVGGNHMTFFILEQLPLPTPARFADPCEWDLDASALNWIEVRMAELTYTAWDMESTAKALGDNGPPFVWNPERRAVLRNELDGAFFHMYGINRGDTEYVLSTFTVANRRDPNLPGRVLDVYDRIADAIDAGESFRSALDPPPGLGLRHPDKP